MTRSEMCATAGLSSGARTSAISKQFLLSLAICGSLINFGRSEEQVDKRTYDNRLTPISNPQPLLADHPEFVEPIRETARFEAAAIVDQSQADLDVRAWRFSYNARGIVETPNHLRGKETAIIVVHPWGIDDGQGWITPQPAGVAFQCTPEKNKILNQHIGQVIDPFLTAIRPHVGLVLYSLPGKEDAIRKQIYRSFRAIPTAEDRRKGGEQLKERLANFEYRGQPLAKELKLDRELPLPDYFKQFRGLDATATFNNTGFWEQPVPVSKQIHVDPQDVVIYDGEGYPPLRDFLKKQGIRHVLLTGYNTDMCFCKTTAGYDNLSPDFNVFLVGDATIATFPANPSPQFATNAAISFASLEHLVTQVSWIKPRRAAQAKK
ncbi:MAG TPA: isochorismatase family protein [Pirellulales bacterium]